MLFPLDTAYFLREKLTSLFRAQARRKALSGKEPSGGRVKRTAPQSHARRQQEQRSFQNRRGNYIQELFPPNPYYPSHPQPRLVNDVQQCHVVTTPLVRRHETKTLPSLTPVAASSLPGISRAQPVAQADHRLFNSSTATSL